MSKFPFNGDEVFGWGDKAAVFANKHRMGIAISLALVLGIYFLISLQPLFYAQAYAGSGKNGIEKSFVVHKDGKIAFEKLEEAACEQTGEDMEVAEIFKKQDSEFEKELYEMVGDHPIKEMVPYIAEKDRRVAGFLVGIAKKESNWGKRVPTQNGQDCFNYWGYKGTAENGSAMGYACFASAKEAVEKVGGRLEQLVGKNLDTPGKMVVWKCGSSCSGHDPAGVSKWISDVSFYFNRISHKKA